ncbi:MAG TPA: AzlD domain-containing protein [Ilumatobacter sp.]|nr:AzlD domain-containing protein [Ilumatobacter sp.]
MSTSTALVVVAVLAVSTYLMRAGLILLLSEATVPKAVERSLRYVGPAVLAALVVNLAAGGEGGPHIELAEVLALVGGGAVMWWRRNLILAVIAGMCVLWIVTALS